MVEFTKSVTKDNLMRAFAGESQARNRYTFAASQAKKNGLYVISAIFAFTASQEQEHAEIFYNHLKEMAGNTIFIDGGYPIDISDNVADLLSMAQHNEYEEHFSRLPASKKCMETVSADMNSSFAKGNCFSQM